MLISLKYFEISQIIEYNEDYSPLIAKDNKFIQYFIKNKKLTIIKNEFNEDQGVFNPIPNPQSPSPFPNENIFI